MIKRVDISGFGGPYENACQWMLTIGLEWIKDKPTTIWDEVRRFKNIYGILETPDVFRDLEEKWNEEIAPSGAMHQAVMNHLAYIHIQGYDAWIERGKDRLIDYDPSAPAHFESPEAAFKAGSELGEKLRRKGGGR